VLKNPKNKNHGEKLFMKLSGVIAISFLILCYAMTAQAETLYVKVVQITMRREPGNDRKILAMLSPGDALEVVEKVEGWTKVRTAGGKEGWVLTHYLVPSRPSLAVSDDDLEKEQESLSNQIESLTEENNTLKEEIKRLSSGFTNDEKAVDELSKSYETLKAECADFLKLQLVYKKTSARLEEQKKKAELLEKDLDKLRKDHRLRWALSGAGVLFLGIIIGALKGRSRRSSFM
jgi:SH3 domain protein